MRIHSNIDVMKQAVIYFNI